MAGAMYFLLSTALGRSRILGERQLEAEVDPAAALLEVRPRIGREGPRAEEVDQVPRAILPVQVDGIDPLDVPRPVIAPAGLLRAPRRVPAADPRPVFPEEIQA